MAEMMQEVERRAAAGDGDAQFTVARLFDSQGRHDAALPWLHQAAQAGHLPSLTWLGSRLLVGRAAPFAPKEGAAFLLRAAEAGAPEAALLTAAAHARGVGVAQDWALALEWLERAAERGEPRARRQLGILSGDRKLAERAAAMAAARRPWSRLRESVDVAGWTTPPAVEIARESPRIGTIRGFAPPEACRWLIERARPKLAPTLVIDPEAGAGRPGEMRNARGMGISLLDGDVVLALLQARAAAATGLPEAQQEPPNVLHYEPGQQYEPHYDFLNPEVASFARQIEVAGQRVATFLLYLNDGFEGGETDFPSLDWRFKGGAGDALFFFSVDADGRVDERTLHAGLPPRTGEKWLLSQWIRDRPQPPV